MTNRTPFERAMGDAPIQVVSLGENLPSYTTLHYQLQNALAVNAELVAALKLIENDMVADKQAVEYYKRIMLVWKSWARAALAKVGQ